MKSSDNTLLLAGLFVLIVVIIALIVYYTRPGETKTLEQTSDTTKLTVENLTFERTLNPDPSVGNGVSGYTIEPYGVEYAGSADYDELSKNVTFTMNWDNAPGFNDVVKGFKIEHYVDANKKHTYNYNSLITTETTDNNGELISFKDFGKCNVKLTSANWATTGSVIGQNKFKLFALVGTDGTTDSILYDGTVATGTPATFPPALKISQTQLSVTLSMTTPITTQFKPEKAEGTSTRAVISKTVYDISNNHTTLTKNDIGIYLETVEGSNNKNFYFQYEDGKYLLEDLSKGNPTTTKPKLKVEIVNKKAGTSIGEIKKVGEDKYLSSPPKLDANEDPKLGLYTTNDSRLNKKTFEGFKWTFNERISKSLVPSGQDNFIMADDNGKFGNVVCVFGDDAFVGQPNIISNSGKVHIYRREGGVWKFKKTIDSSITNSDPASNRYFGCSISISKDYAVIGEKQSPGQQNKAKAGKVYILKRDADGNWETRTQGEPGFFGYPISIKGNTAGELFGSSVAVSDKFLVVGAPGIGTYSGSLKLFKFIEKPGVAMTVAGRGTKEGKAAGELFGYAVDISGDRVIVGAPHKGGVFPDSDRGQDWTGACGINSIEVAFCPDSTKPKNPEKTGSVSIYIIKRSGTGAEQLVLEREMNPGAFSSQPSGDTRFGESVAIDGMIAVIGMPGKKGYSTLQSDNANVGAVYVLKGDGDRKLDNKDRPMPQLRWGLQFAEMISDSDGKNGPAIPNVRKNGEFGKSVSISDGKICVGQPGGVSGDVYVYKHKLFGPNTEYFYGRDDTDTSDPPPESRIKLDLVKTIKSPTNTSNGEFGNSVSNSDGYVMIGEPAADLQVGTSKKRVGSAFITAI